MVLAASQFAPMNLRAQEQKLQIAAAADLKFAMVELSKEFETKTGTKIDVTSGSSGNFFAQIQSGAPFDLFFSADIEYPKRLDAAGLAEPGTLLEYAVGRIVIWAPASTSADIAKQGWSALLEARVQKIAIANPAHAPYGQAAVSALQKAGIYARVRMKLIFGENISQAAQFVQSGNAQAGIIAYSLALSPAMRNGKWWEIPAELHPAIEQSAVMLKATKNQQAAREFLTFLTQGLGRAVLERYGFLAPTAR